MYSVGRWCAVVYCVGRLCILWVGWGVPDVGGFTGTPHCLHDAYCISLLGEEIGAAKEADKIRRYLRGIFSLKHACLGV